MQSESKPQHFAGIADMTVAGSYSNGRSANIDLDPVSVSLDRYTQIEGQAELPQGFRPRQVTVKIRGEGSQKIVATRTLIVQR